MTIQDKIVPNLVGVDIGCRIAVAKVNIGTKEINFDELDETIRKFIQVVSPSEIKHIHTWSKLI